MNIPFTYSSEELIAATYELLLRNNIQDAYIRPLIYTPANMGFNKCDTLIHNDSSMEDGTVFRRKTIESC
ncbi:MAG: hypothetical protein WKF59_02435 [Chitinophagaceae bacterium]